MAELHNQVFFTYLKMCFENAFDNFVGMDLLGNAIYAEAVPTKLSEAQFIIKPSNPINFGNTFFFNHNLSQNSYFKTDIASFSLRLAQFPIESYFDFAACVLSPEKDRVIINFVEGSQFWGESHGGKLLDGKVYLNDQDFNTICHQDTYQGRLSISSKNFRYEGFFQESLPHYYGKYFVNNNLIYQGELRRGRKG